MKLIFSLVSALLLFIGCSTNNGVTTVVPAAPTSLIGTAVSGTQINLSWVDNATNEVGYKIQRLNTSGNYTDIGSTGADINTFSDLGLTPSTSYTYRVYAYNSAGNSLQYSNVITVATSGGGSGGNSVTDIDGNVYPTVQICNQLWTAKNLSVTRYRNGDIIPQVTDPTQWANLTTGAWCWSNNDSATYAANYGKLYNWYAINDSRGLAPEGWEIPLKSTWDSLVKFIDNTTDTTQGSVNYGTNAGGPMKQIGTSLWRNPNRGGTNTSGFTGLPGGCRTEGSSFIDNRVYGVWWSKTEYLSDYAWFVFLGYDYLQVGRSNNLKKRGFSVRCVKR
jgi:uncharacterized protein (TIGR02145 family)